MEPARHTVLCDHVVAARGSFGNVRQRQVLSGYSDEVKTEDVEAHRIEKKCAARKRRSLPNDSLFG